jgi:hypothetical protein
MRGSPAKNMHIGSAFTEVHASNLAITCDNLALTCLFACQMTFSESGPSHNDAGDEPNGSCALAKTAAEGGLSLSEVDKR